MEVQLGWFYQTRYGSVVRIKSIDNLVDNFFAVVVDGRRVDPWGFHLVTSDGLDMEAPRDPTPLLILESGSWLHDLTAAWKPEDGILAECLKEAGRKGT